ncbi:MAG: DUF4143 domain-containing protein [Anaerolineae bacterium]|uniref:DUF4143 domain-containing protein n=1 Tax=Candidatus Amarolinea dominans TaxID=3140696 RepID=UPI001D6D7958|nr:DUF4143 domain-containing protein [Anaerolineae bacterium]MBK7200837.1 DUF4143 domain-containing protein [Anaerolineae bacterium]MBK9093677.1 DUF4143 domain-containing protein [Anaerolineae bacterium]
MGAVFETSVYTELLKRYGSQQVGYWRTTDKREVDFIVRQPGVTLLIETKLTFPHGTPPLLKAAGAAVGDAVAEVEDYRVVGLYGRPAEDRMIYPWQLYF